LSDDKQTPFAEIPLLYVSQTI